MSDAIGQHVVHMAESMVEQAQAQGVRQVAEESYQVVVFDEAADQWLKEFVESVVRHEVGGIAAQQVTYESVEAHKEDVLEEVLRKCASEIASQTLEEETVLTSVTQLLGEALIDAQIVQATTEDY